jgi:hypothetical protein
MDLKNRAENIKNGGVINLGRNRSKKATLPELEAPTAAALHLVKQKRRVGGPDLHESERASAKQ